MSYRFQNLTRRVRLLGFCCALVVLAMLVGPLVNAQETRSETELTRASGPARESSPDSAENAKAPRRFKIIQMNLCLHQVNHKGSETNCWRRRGSDTTMTPFKKRREAIRIIKDRKPNVVTLNEVCRNDVERIAKRAKYEWRFSASNIDEGPCNYHRGKFGNAILARDFKSRKVDRGDFGGSAHNWMCAKTKSRVLACTSHLICCRSGDDSEENEDQCDTLRRKLAGRKSPVVFGGDVNVQADDDVCRNDRMWGRSDFMAKENEGWQHVYVSRRAFEPIGEHGRTITMLSTDHDAFVVRMKRR